MPTKGNPLVRFRVPQANLDAYKAMADKSGKEVSEWAKGLLDYAAGVGNKPAAPSRRKAAADNTVGGHEKFETKVTQIPSQLEREAAELEAKARRSPFDK